LIFREEASLKPLLGNKNWGATSFKQVLFPERPFRDTRNGLFLPRAGGLPLTGNYSILLISRRYHIFATRRAIRA
jgi:hypothetical protein